MKIRQVTPNDQTTLVDLMCESHTQESSASPQEWEKTEAAIKTLVNDAQAGEAYFLLGQNDKPVGYMIMCRGFSLDYGGYFTWIEETYVRKSEQGRFRDQRFSP
jgi:hypothetical protein